MRDVVNVVKFIGVLAVAAGLATIGGRARSTCSSRCSVQERKKTVRPTRTSSCGFPDTAIR